VLHRSLTDSGGRELVEDLLGETDQMNAVLSDLLLLARLDAGKLSVATELFTLAAVVSETAERFGARAGTEEVRLEVIDTGKVPACGDPNRTGQILAALLDNALRFTPPGGAVEVTTHTQNGRVEATVKDTGSGIPHESRPKKIAKIESPAKLPTNSSRSSESPRRE
jgi:signal transduction histidine kinase